MAVGQNNHRIRGVFAPKRLVARDFFTVLELGLAIVLVHQRNDVNRNFFRARRFAFSMIGA